MQLHSKIPSLTAIVLGLATIASAPAARAQQFQPGDIYINSASISESPNPYLPISAIVRVDGISGATSIMKQFVSPTGQYSNIAYDAVRDRLVFTYFSGDLYTAWGITAMDAAGNETLIPFGPLPYGYAAYLVAPSSNGNIYGVRNLGGGPTPYVFDFVDIANITHTLIDGSTGLQFFLTTQPRHMFYEPTTNSLFVTSFDSTSTCGYTQSTVVRKIPLSADGSTVVGPVQSVTVCVSGEFYGMVPVGLSRGAGTSLNLTTAGYINVNTAIFSIDPATLTATPTAQILGDPLDPMADSGGVYSHIYNRTAILDSFGDRLRMGSAAGIWTLTPSTSDPMVSSIGGSGEVVTLTEVDYGGLGLQSYGSGLAGCDGPEVLYGLTAPKAGSNSFRFACTNAPPNSLGLVIVGDAIDQFGSDYFGIGIPIYIDVFMTTQFIPVDMYSNAYGDSASGPLSIDASLVGMEFYAEAIWAWTTCSLPPLGLSASSGLKLTIQ